MSGRVEVFGGLDVEPWDLPVESARKSTYNAGCEPSLRV